MGLRGPGGPCPCGLNEKGVCASRALPLVRCAAACTLFPVVMGLPSSAQPSGPRPPLPTPPAPTRPTPTEAPWRPSPTHRVYGPDTLQQPLSELELVPQGVLLLQPEDD